MGGLVGKYCILMVDLQRGGGGDLCQTKGRKG